MNQQTKNHQFVRFTQYLTYCPQCDKCYYNPIANPSRQPYEHETKQPKIEEPQQCQNQNTNSETDNSKHNTATPENQ